METADKIILKSFPVLLSFLGFEFIIYFFLIVSFRNDFSSVWFFVQFPLILRIPLFFALAISFITFIKAENQKHVFLAIFINLLIITLYFEINVFKSIPNPFLIIGNLVISLYSRITA